MSAQSAYPSNRRHVLFTQRITKNLGIVWWINWRKMVKYKIQRVLFFSACIPEVPRLHLVCPKQKSYSALLPEQISAAWSCYFQGFALMSDRIKPWIHFTPSVNNSLGEPQDRQHGVHYLRWKMQISFQVCGGQRRGYFLYSRTLQEHLILQFILGHYTIPRHVHEGLVYQCCYNFISFTRFHFNYSLTAKSSNKRRANIQTYSSQTA